MRSRPLSILARTVGLATVAAVLSYAGTAGADILPVPAKVPVMTLKIYNNDSQNNIYPVLTTGVASKSVFLQAFFKIKVKDLGTNTFPKAIYRFYINPTGVGIPPGKHVIVKVPLFTQLVPGDTIDSTKPQLINWWEGGRIEVFDAPKATGKPPVALTKLVGAGSDWTSQKSVTLPAIDNLTVPKCVKQGDDDPANNACPANGKLDIYTDSVQFLNNEPSQTFEFTLGAAPDVIGAKPNNVAFAFNPRNVDIDVSYVDIAYLSGAMAPYNPTVSPLSQTGYIGSIQEINKFKGVIDRFITTPAYVGWPQYRDRQGKKIPKIASPLHAFAGDDLLIGKTWPPITAIRQQWDACTKDDTNTSALCKKMRAVRDMFLANYKYYSDGYKTNVTCNTDGKNPDPVKLDKAGNLLFSHIEGFTPFTEHCAADAFQLYNTPGYEDKKNTKGQVIKLGLFHTRKQQFDDMQYNKNFNPYVFMIHDKTWANIPNAYAYSVDDAVGNLQADGTGFIIAIGGPKGLPNPTPAESPIIVGLGFSKTDAVKFTKYGICQQEPKTKINPNFAAFTLYLAPKTFQQCLVSLVDNKDNPYFFRKKALPPFKYLPPTEENLPLLRTFIDCSDNKAGSLGKAWCEGIFTYSEQNPGRGPDIHHLITPAPQQPPKTGDQQVSAAAH